MATAAWSAVALVVIGLIVATLFQRDAERSFDARIRADLVNLVREAVAAGSAAALHASVLGPRFREPFSGYAWQVRRGREIVVQSQSLGPRIAGVAEPLPAPLDRPGDFVAPGGVPVRGLAREIRLAGEPGPLIFAVARPRAEIDAGLRYFNTLLIWSLAAFGLLMFAGSLLLARATLAPVTRLSRLVRALRETGRVPAGGRWPSELAPVVEELRDLSDHLDRLVARSRNQASDLAHALKTPLSVIRQLAERLPEDSAQPILTEIDRIGHSLDWHLTRRRLAGARRGSTPVAKVVADVVFALSRLYEERGLDMSSDVAEHARFAGDEEDLEEMVGNLVENACKWARRRVHVAATLDGDHLTIRVEDDGPGIPPAQVESIFRRGTRLDENAPGHGHGLAIVRDIARLYGGRVEVTRAQLGGAAVALELPASGGAQRE